MLMLRGFDSKRTYSRRGELSPYLLPPFTSMRRLHHMSFLLLAAVVEGGVWRPAPRLVVPPSSSSPASKDMLSAQLARQTQNNDVVSIRAGGFSDDDDVDDANYTNKFSALDTTVRTVLQVVTTTCRTLLPPTVACVRSVVAVYAALPTDAILAQVGLVYCFAGGYFPTLFAAVQAAQHSGWEVAVAAADALVDEGLAAVQACDYTASTARELLMENTKIVLATVDPVKINEAVAALYTTWMGVSVVLEREFARTIALSVTIGDYLRPITNFLLAPPAYRCIPEAYHKWVPIVLGWGCKAAAMSVAWRIQRVLTAYSSAVAGGLMFSRSCFRMLRKRGFRLFGLIPKDCDKSSLDEILGLLVAALGLYSQIGNGFSFDIPFPLNLVTWPFELAERWIQWAITKDTD